MFFFTLFLWVVAFVLSEVLRPKPKNENARPAALGDFSFPTATEGRVVPLVWGTVKISGPNVVWYGDLQAKAIKKKVKTGIFSSTTQLQGYKYYVGIQFALCRGIIDHLMTIWVGDKVVFEGNLGEAATIIDQPTLFGGSGVGNGGIQGTFRFYRGTRSQAANAYLAKEPADFLWHDDFSQGEAGSALQIYKKTEEHEYYSVSDNGSTGGFGPSLTHIGYLSVNVVVDNGTGVGEHVRSKYVSTSPGDIHRYCGLLLHSARPRLNDRIKVAMTFEAKAPGLADGGAHQIWMGCKCQDLSPINSQEGVFCIVEDQENIAIKFQSPSTSGAYVTMHTLNTSDGDFSTLTGRHEVEMHVDGGTVTVLVDGLVKGSWTDSRITTIDETNKGFCIGIEGNANVEFFTANDWTNVGIYTFSIDSLDRVLTSSVPAYRGVCHGVFEKGYVGNSTSISPWAFEIQRIDEANFLGLTGGMHRIQENDLNPMCALYEILTDPDWGLAFTSDQIDIDNFTAAATILYNEHNGWSTVIDNPLACNELIAEIERQIDGYLYCDRVTGKWKVTLARNDYVLEDLTLADESNVIEVRDFTRGSWEETTNNVLVEYSNRSNDYATSYGAAQDMANIRLQVNSVVTASEKYTGIKTRKNANSIAWRDLRALAYPLAKATLVVDRTFHTLNPGDVFRWSDARRNIVNMPVRVQRVDLGQLDSGDITLNVIQDVFGTDDPAFADPDNSQWIIPSSVSPKNIEDADRIIFEAPRKFVTVSDENPEIPNRIWVGARPQLDNASNFDLLTQLGTDVYVPSGSVEGFLFAGKLSADLAASTISGSTTFTLLPDPDNLIDLTSELLASTPTEIGTTLSNLLLVGDELIAFESFTGESDDIIFTNVWRGLLDTVPAFHPENTRVWLICVNGNLTDIGFAGTDTVNVKLLLVNPRGQLGQGVASPTAITLDNRYIRPYPPTELVLNAVRWDDAVSLDYDLSGTIHPIGGGGSASDLIDEPFTYSDGVVDTVTAGVWVSAQWNFTGLNDEDVVIDGNRLVLPAYGPVTNGSDWVVTHADAEDLDVSKAYTVSCDFTLTKLDPPEFVATAVVLHTDTPAPYNVGTAYKIATTGGFSVNPAQDTFITVDSRTLAGGGNFHINTYHLSTPGRWNVAPTNPVFIDDNAHTFAGTTFDVTYGTGTADGFYYTGAVGILTEYDHTIEYFAGTIDYGQGLGVYVTWAEPRFLDDTDVVTPGFYLYVTYNEGAYMATALDVSAYVTSGVPFNLKLVVGADRHVSIQIDSVEVATVDLDPADTAKNNVGVSLSTDGLVAVNQRAIPDIVAENFLAHGFAIATPDPFNTVAADGTVAGIDEAGIRVEYTRRDYRNTNEVLALNESSLPSDFPLWNTTKYAMSVYNDPAGTDTLLYTTDWNTGQNLITIQRSDLIRAAGVIPSRIRVKVKTRHTTDSVNWEAQQDLQWDFDITSPLLAGGALLGVLAVNTPSSVYTVPATDTLVITIGTALGSGAVQYRLNAGAWVTVIAAAATSGNISVTTSDLLEVQHTQAGAAGLHTGFVITALSDGNVKATGIFTY